MALPVTLQWGEEGPRHGCWRVFLYLKSSRRERSHLTHRWAPFKISNVLFQKGVDVQKLPFVISITKESTALVFGGIFVLSCGFPLGYFIPRRFYFLFLNNVWLYAIKSSSPFPRRNLLSSRCRSAAVYPNYGHSFTFSISFYYTPPPSLWIMYSSLSKCWPFLIFLAFHHVAAAKLQRVLLGFCLKCQRKVRAGLRCWSETEPWQRRRSWIKRLEMVIAEESLRLNSNELHDIQSGGEYFLKGNLV